MAYLPPPHQSLGRLVEALNMQNMKVRRLAVVASVDSVVKVFVERYADEENLDAVADVLTAQPTIDLHSVGKLEIDSRGRAYVPAADHAEALAALRRCHDCVSTAKARGLFGEEVVPLLIHVARLLQ